MTRTIILIAFALALALSGCDNSSNTTTQADANQPQQSAIQVNSTADNANPPAGTVTLRSALAAAATGEAVTFDPSMDGKTIELTIVGEEHSILLGEVMGMRQEESGPVSYLEGYFERDYGKSALYARKDVHIDASALPNGVTLAWAGTAQVTPVHARVLGVYGDLIMKNVVVTGGSSIAEDISATNAEQPWTLARGGGVAVWGKATLENCAITNNYCQGDFDSSRDRGAFGGGVYANILNMKSCVVSGNSIFGAGAAGGGVFSVGGAETFLSTSRIQKSVITGNRLSAMMCYGAGVYSDGGGIGNRKSLELINCTVAKNLMDYNGIPPFLLGMGYWRGSGAYMSNGFMYIQNCTIVENEVHGVPRTDDLGKSNMAGGVAATIGNAHAVEDMRIGQSIIAGNTVHESGGATYGQDVFTGSLLYFRSMGHNRIGVIDFSQILVPVGEPNWRSLCRRHYPKIDDQDGVALGDVVDMVAGPVVAYSILSAGVDATQPVPISYTPTGTALDQAPPNAYFINEILAEYDVEQGGNDDFLEIFLDRVEDHYGLPGFAANFTTDFENFLQTVDSQTEVAGVQPYTAPDGSPILTLADTAFFGPAQTWPKMLENHPYIHFWHRLDEALLAENIPGMGPEVLDDQAWKSMFSSGPLAENNDIVMTMITDNSDRVDPQDEDQYSIARPIGANRDIGAVEVP
ncbi:MAG: hypothetical protein ACLFOY_01560 [Desulfatibacillaceae bacterium]